MMAAMVVVVVRDACFHDVLYDVIKSRVIDGAGGKGLDVEGRGGGRDGWEHWGAQWSCK